MILKSIMRRINTGRHRGQEEVEVEEQAGPSNLPVEIDKDLQNNPRVPQSESGAEYMEEMSRQQDELAMLVKDKKWTPSDYVISKPHAKAAAKGPKAEPDTKLYANKIRLLLQGKYLPEESECADLEATLAQIRGRLVGPAMAVREEQRRLEAEERKLEAEKIKLTAMCYSLLASAILGTRKSGQKDDKNDEDDMDDNDADDDDDAEGQ